MKKPSFKIVVIIAIITTIVTNFAFNIKSKVDNISSMYKYATYKTVNFYNYDDPKLVKGNAGVFNRMVFLYNLDKNITSHKDKSTNLYYSILKKVYKGKTDLSEQDLHKLLENNLNEARSLYDVYSPEMSLMNSEILFYSKAIYAIDNGLTLKEEDGKIVNTDSKNRINYGDVFKPQSKEEADKLSKELLEQYNKKMEKNINP